MKTDIIYLYSDKSSAAECVKSFRQEVCVGQMIVVVPDESVELPFDCIRVVSQTPFSTASLKEAIAHVEGQFVAFALKRSALQVGQFGVQRMQNVCSNSGAAMVYADYYETKEGVRINHPVIDYQAGSLRDDFNFGPVQLMPSAIAKNWMAQETESYLAAGFYALRLFASRQGELLRMPEFLFSMVETDTRKTGEKQFDYVSAAARETQLEMERACTLHLTAIGGFLDPNFRSVDFSDEFPVEASVIIPVRNRAKTIRDAVESVLKQETAFPFNLIVVDNFSTDGTSEILSAYAAKNELIHVIPERNDLGIGGCWNVALFHPECGKFAVQLDSDDVYKDENTLQTIVDKFYAERCAMVVGTYQMTNFNLEEIPPGIIDHKEWTPENGPNNALRINGLGAPRAFYAPLLRALTVPNTSYGEDYALGIALSREYKIGRIYDPIYLCRRWEENSDAALDVNKTNAHNHYKDKLRTIELLARIRKNRGAV